MINCQRHYFIPFPEFHKIPRYLFINFFLFEEIVMLLKLHYKLSLVMSM